MCRLYGFRASAETKVECTLVHAQNALLLQSRSDLRGKSHPDGWGIGFYPGTMPEVEHRAAAAYQDVQFGRTAERVYSRTVVAHIRMATIGSVALENTHPFSYGPWIFAHNGTLTAFATLEDRLVSETGPRLQTFRRGSTDSEQIFFWLLSRLERAGIAPETPCSGSDLATLKSVVAVGIDQLARWCAEASADKPARLNVILTDGVFLVATLWNQTLYWVGRRGIHDCEICGIPHVRHAQETGYRAVVVASEPISQEDWREIPDRSLLTVDPQIVTTIEPIAAIVNNRP
jgi:predicted glutamine amidotransferase